MRPSKPEQQALIGLLTTLYGEIREIEAAYQLLVGGGDFRPRIEYFHDAVRALTSGSDDVYGTQGRLSVESLAYDIQALRHIQSAPVQPAFSPVTSVVSRPPNIPSAHQGFDRTQRQRLLDLYKNYTVLFVAILADPADRNYHTRLGDLNQDVETLAQIQEMLKVLAKGQGSEAQIEELIAHLHQEELRQAMMAILHQRVQQKRSELTQKAHQAMQGTEREIASIEAAHFSYVTGQLAVYEDSKDLVKKMAGQGLNIVGQFVESAMQQAQRGRGGPGR